MRAQDDCSGSASRMSSDSALALESAAIASVRAGGQPRRRPITAPMDAYNKVSERSARAEAAASQRWRRLASTSDGP